MLAGTLPQVSWVVTNQQFSEHPDGAPERRRLLRQPGAQGARRRPRRLQLHPRDHRLRRERRPVRPRAAAGARPPGQPTSSTRRPAPTASAGPLPVGLGFRVPLLLVSPVDPRRLGHLGGLRPHLGDPVPGEVDDRARHSPRICPNISAWRRRVCGDLTGAFDFKHPVYGLPSLPIIGAPIGEAHEYAPGARHNAMPAQEPGTKPARPLPYQPNANLTGFTTANGAATANLALQQQRSVRRPVQPLLRLRQPLATRRRCRELPGRLPRPVHGRAVRPRGGDGRGGRPGELRPAPTTSPSSARTGSCAGSPAT